MRPPRLSLRWFFVLVAIACAISAVSSRVLWRGRQQRQFVELVVNSGGVFSGEVDFDCHGADYGDQHPLRAWLVGIVGPSTSVQLTLCVFAKTTRATK